METSAADLQAARDQLFAARDLWEQLLDEARSEVQGIRQVAADNLAVARAEVKAQNEETKTEVENSTDDEYEAASKAFRKKQEESHAELEDAVAVIDSTEAAILVAEAERKAERRSELKETKAEVQSRHDEFGKDLADMTVKIGEARSDAKSEAVQRTQDHFLPFHLEKLHEVQEEGKLARWFAGQRGDLVDQIIGVPSGHGYLHDVGEIFVGYGNVPGNVATGVYTVFRHPIQTGQGIYHAVTNPIDTAKVLYKVVVDKWQTNRGKGEIIGEILATIATGGAIKAAKEAGHFSKLANAVGAAKNKSGGRILNAKNTSPQIIKEAGEVNRLVATPRTYLGGLVELEDFAKANGWKIVGQNKNELVHLGSKKAFTHIDDVNKEIRIYLTAEKGSEVRVIEFADELSHAVNAIRGVDDGNSALIHLRNFEDAANSTLIPYTDAERTAILRFREILAKYADDLDGTGE